MTVKVAYIGEILPEGVTQGKRIIVNVGSIRPFVQNSDPVLVDILVKRCSLIVQMRSILQVSKIAI